MVRALILPREDQGLGSLGDLDFYSAPPALEAPFSHPPPLFLRAAEGGQFR